MREFRTWVSPTPIADKRRSLGHDSLTDCLWAKKDIIALAEAGDYGNIKSGLTALQA
jgi:hypothetical protein